VLNHEQCTNSFCLKLSKRLLRMQKKG